MCGKSYILIVKTRCWAALETAHMFSTKDNMKYNLEIDRQTFPRVDEPDFCAHQTVGNIQFDELSLAIEYGMKLAKVMANPNNEEDMYFLNRGFEETLSGGRAYEVGFRSYALCITLVK